MKKFIAVIVVLAVTLSMLCGCGGNTAKTEIKNKLEEKISFYPLYERLDAKDRDKYIDICLAVESHKKTPIITAVYDSKEQVDRAVDEFLDLLARLSYEQPQYFWVNPSTCFFTTYNLFGKYVVTIKLSYMTDKADVPDQKEKFEKEINEILIEAEKKTDLFDKVLYVHDTLLANTEYDHELAGSPDTAIIGRSAYGCLVENKTVCSGYSKAFNLIMQRMGIEGGVEFNSDNFNQKEKIIHVWNYCKLDGEYYYFDLTWNDTGFDTEEYKPYFDFSHIYFGITREELAKSNDSLLDDVATPECNGTKYNYFIKKGMNISDYNFETAKECIKKQKNKNFAVIRFDSQEELEEAENELMKKGKIHLILPDEENIRYATCKTKIHMYIFFE